MNWLDPIEELYNMYLEEEDTLRIVEVVDDRLDSDLDNEDGLANLYLELCWRSNSCQDERSLFIAIWQMFPWILLSAIVLYICL